MNRWGSSADHGPGGDPSWLGGGDRDRGLPGSGQGNERGPGQQVPGADSASTADADFVSPGDGSPDGQDFGASVDAPQAQPAREPRGPEFGREGGEPSAWESDVETAGGEATRRHGRSATDGQGSDSLGAAFKSAIPFLFFVAFAIFFARSAGIGWAAWFVLVAGVPVVKRFIKAMRARDRDRPDR